MILNNINWTNPATADQIRKSIMFTPLYDTLSIGNVKPTSAPLRAIAGATEPRLIWANSSYGVSHRYSLPKTASSPRLENAYRQKFRNASHVIYFIRFS